MKIKLDPGAIQPTRAHDTDAGLDLYALEDRIIEAKGDATFKTGVHVQLPHGCAGILVSKSGLNVKHGITSTGLIDEGYSGEITVNLYNHGGFDYTIKKGDKISQLVIIPVRYEAVEIVDEIYGGERGEAGFGSTGRT
ncbi:dUTP diphosphatase [uncultured Bilophila sp.]|uniref:dUTP diphosphatase n=1 Tax=uncultured Bilophila sp. TaxID=529385 RepID=UPI0026700436|nr:dUTP diphosphatase [uncultured Bilophila sp.]